MSMSAAEFWSDHLAAIECEGVTVAEYARRHDLSAQSLYAWRSRSRERSTSTSTERRVQFTEVFTTQSVARSGLLLRLGDAVLEFDDLPDAGWLASLLGTARSDG